MVFVIGGPLVYARAGKVYWLYFYRRTTSAEELLILLCSLEQVNFLYFNIEESFVLRDHKTIRILQQSPISLSFLALKVGSDLARCNELV